MEKLTGKTAVVTGAASGMGLAMARRFALEDLNVVLSDIDEAKLATAVNEIRGDGGNVEGVLTDVSREADNVQLLDASIDAFGAVDVVCLNAGVQGSIGRSWALSNEDYEWTLGILLNGVIHGVRTFVPHLVEQDEGHVVITASIAGHISSPFGAPYNIAKHGVATLAETLFHELKVERSNVGVTCLCPGFVNTNIVNATAARESGSVGSAIDDRGDQMLELTQRALSGGLDPEVVGRQVFDAISNNQFWLFTDEDWDEPIAARADQVARRSAPRLQAPSQR
ncbi:MAG: SDR family NAD(P)-dependent oxidoreductase [Actinomycetota bacterium]|jgi:NAD(P)-dependent dehydrogenase (short-subunit alcohol dehydrogenase family)|nr:SDR family NAD(P)-dependent oxidoreductase [Actinomycetota bacterium]MEC9473631.1 SDR family NAD(P)-dependent oxidoreductase [Actinomycetota bacterium]MEE3256388.1 SDR family NAD(P)-dependent oxidoreductase [Actinomycetota bacterium]